jgi:hypothetical protein
MLWRKFKLEWSYAIGELFIVVVGVLVALAIDQWNDQRLERQKAEEILQHLLIDLQTDVENLQRALARIEEKQDSLERLRQTFKNGDQIGDKIQFLSDIVVGANFGWNQGIAQRVTYDEALASGKFSLLRNAELRARISTYYSDWVEYNHRTDERETAYPAISYRLVPRRLRNMNERISGTTLRNGEIGILRFDSSVSAAEVEVLVTDARASELRDHVIAETNFGRFVQAAMTDLHTDARELIEKLTEYRNSLE